MAKIKTKNCLVVACGLIFGFLLVLWVLNSPTPRLRSFVSNTQLHIKNIKNINIEMLDNEEGESIFRNEKNFNIDSTYLELLGFIKEPTLFGDAKKENVKSIDMMNSLNKDPRIPPLVTAFRRFGDKEKALIESKMKYFLDDLILIYDLDLSSSEQLKVIQL